jgi:hypothetical protein
MTQYKSLPAEIEFSTFGPKLSEQLAGRFDPKILDRYNFIADALTACLVHGMIPPSQCEAGRKKLVKKIVREWKAEP